MTDLTTLSPTLASIPQRGSAITPSDNTDLPYTLKLLMVTVAGDVSVLTLSGDEVTLPNCQPGTQYEVAATRVRATGTDATGIVGLGD